MDNLEKAGSVAVSLALGALVKHKTRANHKATGVTQNVLVGQVAAGLLGGSPEDGAAVAVLTEAALNVSKGAVHGVKSVWRGARFLFDFIRRR